MRHKSVLSKEAALQQVELFCDYYDLSDEFVTKAAQPQFEALKAALCKDIMRGRVEITEDKDSLKIVQNLKNSIDDISKFEYGTISSVAKIAMGNADGNSQSAILHLMASLAGVPYVIMHKAKGVDMSALETLANFLLQV